ncbi:MAG: AraC family transcriptional regulator [Chromatiaceae bacterium]|nr:AraC family transcriptional regulator [Chromatiaceae bacterium]
MSTLLATAARIFHRLLAQQGLEADAMFINAGLDPHKLSDSQARYPLDRIRDLWLQANMQIKDPCWGLSAGDLWRPTDYHALGYAYLASATLESAFQRLERYFRIVIQDFLVQSEVTSDCLKVTHKLPDYAPNFPAIQDARLSINCRLCHDVYGKEFRLQEVQLAHPWQPCGYEDFFGCPVRFDAEFSGFSIPLDVARRPLPAKNRDLARANDQILQDLERRLIDDSTLGRVKSAILDSLTEGTPSAQAIARELAVSPRTLQRKLQEEGTTFQAQLDMVRKELAERYIRSGSYDLQTITYLTGFANPPAFSRAYKKWTGRSPSEDREGGRA